MTQRSVSRPGWACVVVVCVGGSHGIEARLRTPDAGSISDVELIVSLPSSRPSSLPSSRQRSLSEVDDGRRIRFAPEVKSSCPTG